MMSAKRSILALPFGLVPGVSAVALAAAFAPAAAQPLATAAGNLAGSGGVEAAASVRSNVYDSGIDRHLYDSLTPGNRIIANALFHAQTGTIATAATTGPATPRPWTLERIARAYLSGHGWGDVLERMKATHAVSGGDLAGIVFGYQYRMLCDGHRAANTNGNACAPTGQAVSLSGDTRVLPVEQDKLSGTASEPKP